MGEDIKENIIFEVLYLVEIFDFHFKACSNQ
jgi:hypothetical protein